jgi:hypothetical protein
LIILPALIKFIILAVVKKTKSSSSSSESDEKSKKTMHKLKVNADVESDCSTTDSEVIAKKAKLNELNGKHRADTSNLEKTKPSNGHVKAAIADNNSSSSQSEAGADEPKPSDTKKVFVFLKKLSVIDKLLSIYFSANTMNRFVE